jgi:hypothetical protein
MQISSISMIKTTERKAAMWLLSNCIPSPREATPLIRPDFKCTEIVKYYQIVSPPQERPPLL